MRHRYLLIPVVLMFACSGSGDKEATDTSGSGGTDTANEGGSDTGDTEPPTDTSDTDPPEDTGDGDDTGGVDTGARDVDGDGHTVGGGDCDDADPAVFPGADEVCNLIDDNCDGEVDNDPTDGVPAYIDADGDTFGDPETSARVCGPTPGFSADGSDCDDTDATRYIGAPELCDGIDNDCDGGVDEDAPGLRDWYADADGDGYGDPDTSLEACSRPEDMIVDSSDCDDTSTSVYPGALEFCDGKDNDCDGEVDTDSTFGLVTFYVDADGDGYGVADATIEACAESVPDGYVGDDTDCDDTEAASHPGASEVCDGIDNDCDGWVDLDDPGGVSDTTWYRDADGDGWGTDSDVIVGCEMPSGYVDVSGDCDDGASDISPDMEEIHCDDIDNDCDGASECIGYCGDGMLGDDEEYDPAPGPWETIVVDAETCRWDLSDVRQIYCNGSCSWDGERDCDDPDADLLCRMMLDSPDAIALDYSIGPAIAEPGYACSLDGYGEELEVRDRGDITVLHFEDGPLSETHGGGLVIYDPDCVIPE